MTLERTPLKRRPVQRENARPDKASDLSPSTMRSASGLRIGIDAHVLVGKMQGSRTWLVNVIGRAVARHPDATYVIYSDDPSRAATMISGANVEHVRLPHVPRVLRLLAVWPWLVHRDRIDALVTTYIAPPFVPGSRQVSVVHDILFETHPDFFTWGMRWRTRLLTRLSAKRARLVVTISRYSRDSIARTYRIDPSRIAEVRCGTSPPRTGAITRSPIRDGRPYLMMVGRLEPRKNLALTLDAFACLPPGAARLVVVGKPDGERPETLARLSSMADVVHVAGIDDRGLGDLYADAAALVFPSAGEGWGIPVLESLALGTPVIASNVTAIPESGGDAASYFDLDAPDRVERLAGLMQAAVEGRLPFDAARARAHVARHDWDGPATAFVDAMRRAFPARDTATAALRGLVKSH